MDGKYHKNAKIEQFTLFQKSLISEWILDSINGNKWENDNDLHIDEIIQGEIPQDHWVDISFLTVKFANEEITRLGIDSIIPIMYIPLYGDEYKIGINFEDLNGINSELDFTPPSLFVCPINWESFKDAFFSRDMLYDILLEKELYSLYYYEELHPNGLEHIRNISILPKKHIKFLQENGWNIP